MITILTTLDALKTHRHAQKGTIGFVPTMGALHAGHARLMHQAKHDCDHVIASIFVNPKQFGANEDLSTYPRTFEEDCTLLDECGVDAVFAPSASAFYPEGFATEVRTLGLDHVLCGAHRVGHFTGVTTVVARLFAYVRPDRAYFGEKDFQQLCIIRRMNEDLPLAGAIIGVPTMREADGLAMSSRNRYLSEAQRKIAAIIPQLLTHITQHATPSTLDAMLTEARMTLEEAGFILDYLEVRDADTLTMSTDLAHARIFIAARLGTTRLIDNMPFVQYN
ncbi:MAG: pantoate--beta-alanine ligase [Alphaproteobacteria bacterium]|nr:MAG: pantoate--beta-alanine ligase [Alphaproteobacteria bacterium]TAF13600.1 MAG: pantoate--beta-alanine ligase [Alphaproteobacteria bacterium]TAF39166.1 MAG: pantoate--beta-alanine ligase [Alphaproteobacteria bacterium]TAF74959.1 MAG: pantoate--beta-alanine ligase [Alphaproteobacteria bacterium]